MTRSVEIIGGGLAGLGLGIALRREGVPVTIHESGRYPRHRVCGEFITSLDAATRETLGLDRHLSSALPASAVSWCEEGTPDITHRLPEPALCLSRYRLDNDMADEFVSIGGELHTNSRATYSDSPGRVFATGRRPDPSSSWVGIKQHFRGLRLRNDLEVHFGSGSYVGLTRVDAETVNVCGLFDKGAASVTNNFGKTLLCSGFAELADRVRGAEPVADSFCAVAGLNYRRATDVEESLLRIGDSQALVPPFTGHGMTMALQSAAEVLPHLLAWVHGDRDWAATKSGARRAQRMRFGARLRVAQLAHPYLLDRRIRHCARRLHRLGVLPVALLYRMMH